MKKVFISQPMKGKSDVQIGRDREYLIKRTKEIIDDEVEIIDSFMQGAPHLTSPVLCLGESIKMLSQADIVVFSDLWHTARGCRIEHMIADEYQMSILVIGEDGYTMNCTK